MDIIAHCRAMAAFCRQHAQFENEDTAFWIDEAKEWDNLIAEYSIRKLAIQPGPIAKGGDPFTTAWYAS
jgi:hypothetical protein